MRFPRDRSVWILYVAFGVLVVSAALPLLCIVKTINQWLK